MIIDEPPSFEYTLKIKELEPIEIEYLLEKHRGIKSVLRLDYFMHLNRSKARRGRS